jgi:MFS transporter, ACS family, tartrate transporter
MSSRSRPTPSLAVDCRRGGHGNQSPNPFSIRRQKDDSETKIKLLPFLFLLFVVAFVDRINIGFAALTMNKELAITSQQFGFAAGTFFIGYFIFEVPSNLLLHLIGARLWIARILITWGVLATVSGFVHSVHQLYLLRFLLGLAEAGYFPGIVLYLTYWFRQRERAHAIALFLTGLPVTSIVGAPMSGLILDHVHWLGVSSWRWLFILEGLPAVLCGFVTYFILPNGPAEASFLTSEEKESIQTDLLREEREKLEEHQYSVLQTMACSRVWHLSAIHFGMMIGLYTLSFWGPQLLKSLLERSSNTTIGMLVMVPHLLGLLGMVITSRSSASLVLHFCC